MRLPDVVGLDTNCFVYLFSEDPSTRARFLERHVFGPMVEGSRHGIASAVTLAELLAEPYARGAPSEARELRAAVEGMPSLTVLPFDAETADLAARVRAEVGLRLPDATQVATAVVGGAGALLSNDRALARARSFVDVLVLDDLVGARS